MSLSKSSPRPTNSLLHPSLQVALASLDVPLDAELERYRQHRKRMSPPPPTPASQPVIIEGQLESRAAESSERSPWDVTSEAASGPGVQTDSAVDQSYAQSSETPEFSEVASDRVIDDEAVLDSATAPRTYLESAERLRQGSEGERDSEVTSDDEEEEDPSVVSLSGLSTTSSQAGEGTQRKFTALGVGSVLLFLAATATLGYVLVNPESLGQLGLERFFGGGTASEPGDSETSPETTPESASRGTGLPTSPDLAAEEFIQLDLSTLSSLDPETRSPLVTPPPAPQDAPQPSPETAATPPTPAEGTEPAENSLDNISALLTPESTGAAQSEEASETPASENQEAEEANAEPEAPDTAAGPPPRIDRDRNYAGFVFVVVDYNDQVSRLEQVREVVPDAYLREFPDGVKVQVGAFDETQMAQRLVDRLGEDGISAQIYQPR